MTRSSDRQFVVALSFAREKQGERTERIARRLVDLLGENTVFYDKWYEADLAGPRADQKLEQIYSKNCELAVALIDREYRTRLWTSLEFASIRDRADQSPSSVLLLKDGLGQVDDLPFHYIIPDIAGRADKEIADLIIERLKQMGKVVRSVDLPGEPDNVLFGRTSDLSTLRNWVADAKCRLVVVTGLRGIGKSRLVLELCYQAKELPVGELSKAGDPEEFQFIIWKDLRNPKAFRDLALDLLSFLLKDEVVALPTDQDGLLNLLLEQLRIKRCLVVLDNFETAIPVSGSSPQSQSQKMYAALLQKLEAIDHNSCVVVTIPQKPESLDLEVGPTRRVRAFLQLDGLDVEGAKEYIAKELGEFDESGNDLEDLITYVGGNPLLLNLIGKRIHSVYNGRVRDFLAEGDRISGYRLDNLDWHYDNLDGYERELALWLAVRRIPSKINEVRSDLVSPDSRRRIRSTVQSLQRKIPLENRSSGYTLQPVLLDFFTEKIVDEVSSEIRSGRFRYLLTHAVLQTTMPEAVSNAQKMVIVNPILDSIGYSPNVDDRKGLLTSSLDIARDLRGDIGHAGGVLANLLANALGDLSGIDLSSLRLSHVDFRNRLAHKTILSGATLTNCAFTESMGRILTVAISLTGKLAIGDSSGQIHLWDLENVEKICTVAGHRSWVRSLAFSNDGKLLVSASSDRTVKVWSSDEMICRAQHEIHREQVYCAVFSPDSNTVASGSEDQKVVLFEWAKGNVKKTKVVSSGRVRSVAWSVGGEELAIGADNVELWNVRSGNSCVYEINESYARALCFVGDASQVAIGCDSGEVILWSPRTDRATTIGNIGKRVQCLVATDDGQTVFSGDRTGTIRAWNLSSGLGRSPLRDHGNAIECLAISSDGKQLISGSNDQTAKIWDLSTRKCLHTIIGYANPIKSVDVSPDNSKVAIGGHDKKLIIWQVGNDAPHQSLPGHADLIQSVKFSPCGGHIATCSNDGVVRLWSTKSATCEKLLKAHEDWVWDICWQPHGDFLASASRDRSVIIWCTATGAILSVLRGHTDEVHCVAFDHTEPHTLASGSDDRSIRLWDLHTKQCVRTLDGHRDCVRAISFDRRSSVLASGGDDGDIRLWSTKMNHKCLKVIEAHRDRIRDVKFSTDGRFLASAGDDRMVKVWELASGKCIQSIVAHSSEVMSVSFRDGARQIASAGDDGVARIWSVKTGEVMEEFRPDRPYEGMQIDGVKGLGEAQAKSLVSLGAVR